MTYGTASSKLCSKVCSKLCSKEEPVDDVRHGLTWMNDKVLLFVIIILPYINNNNTVSLQGRQRQRFS
jgi:uncharacterized integral membrane protein